MNDELEAARQAHAADLEKVASLNPDQQDYLSRLSELPREPLDEVDCDHEVRHWWYR